MVSRKSERVMTLTKSSVEEIQPDPERRLRIWDDNLKGFGLFVTPAGHKSYFVFYRRQDGAQRCPVIGDHGKLTVDAARKVARQWLADVAHGKDPSQERKTARESITLEAFADIYLRDYARPHKKASSVDGDEVHLKHTIKPALGKKKVLSITKAEIQRLHSSLHETPITANRVLALLSKMFALAEAWGYRPENTNPCRGVPKYKETKRKRYLTPEELMKLGQALEAMEKANIYLDSVINAIRLTMFTGCRRGEVLTLRWEHVNLEAGAIELPDSKTGEKTVYLNSLAVELLKALPRDGSGWVFPGKKEGEPVQEIKRAWAKACELAGIQDLRVHDLRHSFASIGVGLGMSLPIVGALLGHTQAKTTERYAHLMDSPLRAAGQIIGEAMEDVMTGKAKVIELRPKAEEKKEKEKPQGDAGAGI